MYVKLKTNLNWDTDLLRSSSGRRYCEGCAEVAAGSRPPPDFKNPDRHQLRGSQPPPSLDLYRGNEPGSIQAKSGSGREAGVEDGEGNGAKMARAPVMRIS